MFEITRLRRAPDGFHIRFHGAFEIADLSAAVEAVADLAVPGGPTLILSTFDNEADMIARHAEIDAGAARALAATLRRPLEIIGPGRGAAVLVNDFPFATGRMFSGYVEGVSRREFAVFREVASARRWLGIDIPPAG
ncbi:hypothetical protein [Oceanibacterium hippocampi]|uniref:STAS/SEC14 domain-containing protein n=1 Tax=Oceanibacterium hippocampi TaxID=745714 RepID=A0A1Y5SSM1_9PROT|nr:hypothetical protein [Oceanibacterium hippocampi]SLN46065.1 hypothetical protein OCH7691_01977 [Oceanibacterium hippocampi]